MTVGQTRALAEKWVREKEAALPGFVGAYLGGSTAAMDAASEISGGSDMDVYVVLEGEIPDKRGKFETEGALLEVSYVPADSLFPAEKALGDYHLANSLRHRQVLLDPSGRLRALTDAVAAGFAEKKWIAARRDHAISRVRSGLTSLRQDAPLPDLTLSWLFPTGIACHAVLVSALKNPTVRLRYLRAREVLAERGRMPLYERLLSLSGFAQITPAQAEELLRGAERAFDRALEKGKTWFPFSSDISPVSRTAAIDSSRQLIRDGLHRETLFWTLTTLARSMKILLTDAPEDYEKLLPDLTGAVSAVNRGSWDEIQSAAQAVLHFLPDLRKETDEMIGETLEERE